MRILFINDENEYSEKNGYNWTIQIIDGVIKIRIFYNKTLKREIYTTERVEVSYITEASK